jgi:hypothetical protein
VSGTAARPGRVRTPPGALGALRRLAAVLALLAGPLQAAPEPPTVPTQQLDTRLQLGFERVHFGSEGLGLAGATLLFDLGAGWGWGPGVVAAATGRRGGLYVGGMALQRRWRLGQATQLSAELFAGGGGGGGAPVGGGLMLRPALTLWQHLGPLQAGLSLSHVQFPGGALRSQQFGLLLAWDGRFVHTDADRAGQPWSDAGRTGLGWDQVLLTAGRYRPRNGAPGFSLMGARVLQTQGAWQWGLEAAAATQGPAAGYMEVLGEAGAGWAVGARSAVSLRGGLGLAGGGAVPTGGGLLARVGVGAMVEPARGWHLGAELGDVRALNGEFRARSAQLWLAMALSPGPGQGQVLRHEWAAVWQRELRAQRKQGPAQALDTVGLRLNRWLDDHVYLTGQAHSAFAGGAGAYALGLAGLGVGTTPVAHGWRFGAEALAGAAGGGGVHTAGGAVLQGLAWATWAPGPHSQWRLGLGQVKSLRGELNSPVLELSWQRAFGLNAP